MKSPARKGIDRSKSPSSSTPNRVEAFWNMVALQASYEKLKQDDIGSEHRIQELERKANMSEQHFVKIYAEHGEEAKRKLMEYEKMCDHLSATVGQLESQLRYEEESGRDLPCCVGQGQFRRG